MPSERESAPGSAPAAGTTIRETGSNDVVRSAILSSESTQLGRPSLAALLMPSDGAGARRSAAPRAGGIIPFGAAWLSPLNSTIRYLSEKGAAIGRTGTKARASTFSHRLSVRRAMAVAAWQWGTVPEDVVQNANGAGLLGAFSRSPRRVADEIRQSPRHASTSKTSSFRLSRARLPLGSRRPDRLSIPYSIVSALKWGVPTMRVKATALVLWRRRWAQGRPPDAGLPRRPGGSAPTEREAGSPAFVERCWPDRCRALQTASGIASRVRWRHPGEAAFGPIEPEPGRAVAGIVD